MIKKDLIKVMADTMNEGREETKNFTQTDIKLFLDTLITLVTTTLQTEDSVALPPLGKFESFMRKARKGVNPQTGEKLQIPAKKAVRFKASKGFKDAIKGE